MAIEVGARVRAIQDVTEYGTGRGLLLIPEHRRIPVPSGTTGVVKGRMGQMLLVEFEDFAKEWVAQFAVEVMP